MDKNNLDRGMEPSTFSLEHMEIKRMHSNLLGGSSLQIIGNPVTLGQQVFQYIKERLPGDYHCLYIDIKQTTSIAEYFKCIYAAVMNTDLVPIQKKIAVKLTIKANRHASIDYERSLMNLMGHLRFGQKRVILMLQGLPELIHTLASNNNDHSAARQFLQCNRSLRHHPKLHKKIQFIYLDANRLNKMAAGLGISYTINDLASVVISGAST